MNDKQEYMEKLDKIQRDLDWVIQYLLKKDQPVQPPPFNPDYPGWGSTRTICSKCGMEFNGVTSYYCANNDCPVQVKTT